MELFFRKFGEGPPVIILHGLYGSSDNWITIGRALSAKFEVWLIDQRNHGRSPHSDEHNYDVLQDDLFEFIINHNIEKAILIGHSMGGKTAMQFAANYPERISHLIVIDIAPKSYLYSLTIDSDTLNHKKIMEAMLSINFYGIEDRTALNELLSKNIRSNKIRQFLLKNVVRNNDKSLGWGLNIKALYTNIEKILNGFSLSEVNLGDEITGFPVLFIKGGNSDYISEDDKEIIQKIFPYAEFKTIPNTSHWLHAEEPEKLLRILKDFIE